MGTHRLWCLVTAWWPLRSPKGHKISVSGIQGIKISHQDLELATYIDKSDADLKYLVKRNKFLWPRGIQHSELPVLCTEQSHSSLSVAPSHACSSFSSTGQSTSLLIQHKPSISPSFKAPYSILHHSQRAKWTRKPRGQYSYKIIPQPRKFQLQSLSPAAEQIPHALPALQGGVLTYWQV